MSRSFVIAILDLSQILMWNCEKGEKGMKKFLKAILIFFIGLYLASFFVVMKVTPIKQQIRNIDWDQYTNHYYEMLLTKEERALYDKLDETCSAILKLLP